MSRLSVEMHGGGPWGFRLYGGGDSDPLVVAKLRRRSKASEAGLCEGDVLLAINNYSCAGMSHPVAMALVDQAADALAFQVLRGTSDPAAVSAAVQSLGPQYSRPPSSAPAAPAPAPAPAALVVNGFSPQVPAQVSPQVPSQVTRQTFNDGSRQVTTETSRQQFGSTTVTKVKREEVTQFPSKWAPAKAPSPRPVQSVPAPGPAPFTVRAPSNVEVQHHPDQSVTMTLGLDNKENAAPSYVPPSQSTKSQSMFAISRVQTGQPKAIWTPSFIPDLPDRPGPRTENLCDDEPMFQFAPEPAPAAPLAAEPEPMATFDDDGMPRRPLLDQSEDEYARMMLAMIMHADGNPESPNTIWRQKKKVYADSAFYDDDRHQYPTIEEQIKMARRVALSLESPANKKARGHTMFIKRKEKAFRWVADPEGNTPFIAEDDDDKFYIDNPWQSAGHTWQPTAPAPVSAPAPAAPPLNVVPPAAPPLPSDLNKVAAPYKAPVLPLGASKAEIEEKSKAMSMDEFERMRMLESKSQHNKVSPMVSFRLAEDLQSMKGKGAKLFAKRKAKAETWVVAESADGNEPAPSVRRHDKAFIMKLTGGMMPQDEPDVAPPPAVAAPASSGRPRLQEMINPPKADMTPWDAMANYGDVDRAFNHLDNYMASKKGGMTKKIAENLTMSVTQQSSSGPSMPEFSRKIKPWGDRPAEPETGGRAPFGAPGGGFRPIKFKNPGESAISAGVFDAPSRAEVSPAGGFCDL